MSQANNDMASGGEFDYEAFQRRGTQEDVPFFDDWFIQPLLDRGMTREQIFRTEAARNLNSRGTASPRRTASRRGSNRREMSFNVSRGAFMGQNFDAPFMSDGGQHAPRNGRGAFSRGTSSRGSSNTPGPSIFQPTENSIPATFYRGRFNGGRSRGGFQRGISSVFEPQDQHPSANNFSNRGAFARGGARGIFGAPATSENGVQPNFIRGRFTGARPRGGFHRDVSSLSAQEHQHQNAANFSNRGGFARGGSRGISVSVGSRGGFHPEAFKREHTINLTDEQIQRENVDPAMLYVSEDDKLIFGEDVGNKLADKMLPRNRAENDFAPTVREVDEIFDEDQKYAADYDTVTNEDDQIVIEGLEDKDKVELFKEWDELGIHRQLRKNVKRSNYMRPRKIQSAAIPIILKGHDIRVTAETGTGKTLAFLLPIIEQCYRDKRSETFVSNPYQPYAIILGPTRELVKQCYEQASKLVDGTGITVAKVYGEYAVQKNEEELLNACDIICATPGRLADFIRRRWILINELKFLVFDEGDQLLAEDFEKTLDNALLYSHPKMPYQHQTLFFSATFSPYAQYNIAKYMSRDKVIFIKNKVTVPSRKCEQIFEPVEKIGKFGVILTYLRKEFNKADSDTQKYPRTIIFCNQATSCEKLVFGLEISDIPAIPLSGIRGQDLREGGLKAFRENDVSILCVTNLGSRGIDIKDVDLVVNYDMPRDFETYVHRVGRTGRIRHGKCVSFISIEHDLPLLFQIKKALEEAEHTVPPSLVNVIGDYDPAKSHPVGFDTVKNDPASVKADEGVAVEGEKPQASLIDLTLKTQEDKLENQIQGGNPSSLPAEKKEEIADVKNVEAEDKDGAVKKADGEMHDRGTTPIEHKEEKKPVSEFKPPSEEGSAKILGDGNKDECKTEKIADVKNVEAEKLNVDPAENKDGDVKKVDGENHDVMPVPTPVEHEEEKKPADEYKPPAEEGTAKILGDGNKDESKPDDVATGGNDEAAKLNVAPAENKDVHVKNDDGEKHDRVPTPVEHEEEKKTADEDKPPAEQETAEIFDDGNKGNKEESKTENIAAAVKEIKDDNIDNVPSSSTDTASAPPEETQVNVDGGEHNPSVQETAALIIHLLKATNAPQHQIDAVEAVFKNKETQHSNASTPAIKEGTVSMNEVVPQIEVQGNSGAAGSDATPLIKEAKAENDVPSAQNIVDEKKTFEAMTDKKVELSPSKEPAIVGNLGVDEKNLGDVAEPGMPESDDDDGW